MNNERVTLAQELHDGIAQDLVVLGFSIDQAIAHCKDSELKGILRQLRFSTTDLIEKLRDEIHQLRVSDPLLALHNKSDPHFEIIRIVQEVIRNIEKHSGATELTIQINDNGKGGVHAKEGSFGVVGLHERTRKLNGEIHIDSDETGTRIAVKIPLDGQ